MVVRNSRGFSLIELMMVVAIIGVLAAVALPMSGNALRFIKISGDARDIANSAATTKMRAAAKFTKARLFVDKTGRSFYVQTFNKTVSASCPAGCWQTEGGATTLSSTVSFGYGPVTGAPPNTQTTIDQAPPCLNNALPAVAIANTACVVFNSRGIPIDSTGSPFGNDALYITDGTAVYGITVAATGFIRTWKSRYQSTPAWVLQ